MSIVSELRRRQVFRAVAWYGGFAWLAIEVANTIFPQIGLPGWSVRAVIVLALLGLPIAVALAWSFDLSAVGLRRETPSVLPADTRDPTPDATAAASALVWRIPSFWIAIVLGAGLAVSAQQAWKRLVLPAGGRPAIAVLPFANLSPDPENAYFADGLHEEVLATLARTGSLRVISRTSVQQYRDDRTNLTEIADALGADLILEGSVRRVGEDLRLTLQLIDGHNDEHLWAETYDRKFRNTLQLQKTVAEQVVAAIGTTLSPAEQQLIERVAPTVPEAYEAYLHALAIYVPFGSAADNEAVFPLLARSIDLDPRFAPAYALRARAYIAALGYDSGNAALATAARADVERALELEPALADALVARGLYYTYVSIDPERALVDLTRALALTPSDAETQRVVAMTLRRLGRFDEAIEHFNTAASLAPGDQRYAFEPMVTLTRLDRVDESERLRRALADRYPESHWPQMMKYFNQFQATGDPSGWREDLPRLAAVMPEDDRAGFEQKMMLAEGDLERFVASVQAHPVEGWGNNPEISLATAYLALGDRRKARPHLDAVVAGMSAHPDDAGYVADGAIALALLGRTGEALTASDHAVELRPERTDALNGTRVAMERAWVLIYSRVRREEGYRELVRLLGGIDQQPRWVAVSPHWLLLGDDARTQEILRSRFPRP